MTDRLTHDFACDSVPEQYANDSHVYNSETHASQQSSTQLLL